MQNIIGAFINGAVSAYMTEVKSGDISSSLARKNLEIAELDIYPDALLQHGIPLLIKKGTIRNVSIDVPTKFKTDPVVINIDSVTILASLCTQTITPLQIINMKIRLLKAYKFFRKRFKLLLGLLGKDSFLSVVLTIMSNMIISIDKIHIQIEYSSTTNFDASVTNLSAPSSLSKISDLKTAVMNLNDDDDDDEKEEETKPKKTKAKNKTLTDEFGDDFSSDDSSNSSDDLSTANRFSLYDTNQSNGSEKVTSIGIIISRISIHNPADIGTVSSENITKEVVFTNLGVFMDADVASISKDKDQIETEMEKIYKNPNHNWILEPFCFSSLIKYTKDNPQFFFEPLIENIAVNIREDYIPVIMDLMKGFDKLQKKFSVAHIPRPSNDYPLLLWDYCNKCAISKISNPTFDFTKALNLLIKRKIFLKNYKKKKPRNLEVIRIMESTLDYSTIVAFRAAYRLIHRKKKKPKGKSMITIRTTAKILKVINIDPVRLVTGTIGMAAVNFSGNLVSIILRRSNNKKHITINVRKPRFSFQKDLKSYIVNATISYLEIKGKRKHHKERTIFRSMNNDQLEMKVGLKIPFRSYSNWSFSLDVSKNHYTINMEPLLQTIEDISSSDLFINSAPNPSDIIAFIKKRNFELNVSILSSMIKIVGSHRNRALQFAFDKLQFSTDTKTLKRTIKLEKSWVSLISDSEAKISQDFSLSGTMIGKDLSISIPTFSFNVPFKYVVVLEDFVALFMKYKNIFTVSALPKIDINVNVEMKGMEAVIKKPGSSKSKNLKIRKINLNYKDSVLKFSLSSIKLSKLFHLDDLTVTFDKENLDFKLNKIYVKVVKLLSLLPKDAFEILQNKNIPVMSTDDNSDPIITDFQAESDSDSVSTETSKDKTIKNLKKIKINFLIDKIDVDLTGHKTDTLIISLKEIAANGDSGKMKAGMILDQINFSNKSIGQNVIFKSEIDLGEIPEIDAKIDNFNFAVTKELIDFFVNMKLPKFELPVPKSLGFKCKLSLKLDQVSLSNDFVMKNFLANVAINDTKIDLSVGMDSINSSFVKFESKDLAKLSVDLQEKFIKLDINVEEITAFVIPLLDVIAMFPKAKTPSIPKINLLVKVKPLQINLCFSENYLNVILNSPLKFKFNTLDFSNPHVSLKMSKLLVNLNNNEIVSIRSIKFKLNKDVVLEIPSINITVSMVKIYTLIKMISYVAESSLVTNSQNKIAIYTIPFETISTRIPLIQIIVHQTKSRRCITFKLNDTELYLKTVDQKSDFMASTKAHFEASDGILSFDLTQPFKFTCTGMFSETLKNFIVESPNPIKFEISTYVIDQILKNLTATEDETEQPYSIVNETGVNITIIINKKKYKLEPQEHLPKLRKLSESNISVKINHIENPIKIYSAFSKISYPLFFGKHFILVWLDMNKLQLRLLSPIIFKNKSNVDLIVKFNKQTISLKNGDVYCLDYTIHNLNTITLECNGDTQEIPLDENCAVNLDNKFIVVSKKRKIETLHIAIVFSTPFYIRNELTCDLNISFKDQKENKNHEIVLKAGEVVPFPFFQPAAETISFDILDSKFIKEAHVDLNLNLLKNQMYTITTKDNDGNDFDLNFSLTDDKMNIISISPLIIYYNSLAIPLKFSLTNELQINDFEILNLDKDLSTIFPFQGSNNIWNINNPIMFSPKPIENINDNNENNKAKKIYVATKYSRKWSFKPFTLDNYEIIDDTQIPINMNLISYVHCHVVANSHIRPNTFIFFLSPKYVINNQTNKTFSLNLFNEADIVLPPNSTIPVTIIRNSLEISIAIIPKSKTSESNEASSSSSSSISTTNEKEKVGVKNQSLVYSRKFNIDKIYSQFINLYPEKSPVLLQSSTEQEINIISILLNRTLPYVFINNTDSKVVFIQKDTADSSHIVMPFESTQFFIFDENTPTIIYCQTRENVTFELDVNKPTFPIKVDTHSKKDSDEQELYYYVDLSPTKGSTIILCNAENDTLNLKGNKQINDNFIENLRLANHVDDSSFSISLADLPKLRNDLINVSVSFTHVSFLIITTQFQELCNISMNNILIESTIHDFYVKSQISLGSIKIDDQNPYAVYPSVVQILPKGNQPAIFFKIKSFGSHKYGKIELAVRPINVRIDLSFLSDLIGDIFYAGNSSNPDDDDKESSENIKEGEKFAFKMNEVPISEIIHNLMPKETKYHINNLAIHPLKINLSFHTKTTRSIHPLQQKFQFHGFYNVIPSFDNVSISIDEYHSFRNLSGTADEIVFKIEHDIKEKVLSQLHLRDPIGGTKSKIKSAVNKLIHPLDSNIPESTGYKILRRTTLVFSIAESACSYVSSLMDLYTETPAFIRTDETFYGAIHWGFCSFVNSVGEGAKKLVNEPKKRGTVNGKIDPCGYVVGAGVGVTKCAAHLVSGTFNLGASLFSGTRRVFLTEKIAFVDKREREPSLGMHTQDDDEQLLWFSGSVYSGLIEVYSRSIFIMDENKFIRNIIRAEIAGSKVTIFDVDQNRFESNFDDENMAISFYNIIESQLLRKKIIDMPEQNNEA